MTTETELLEYIGPVSTEADRRRIVRILLSTAICLLTDEPTTPAHLEGGGPIFEERVSRL